MIHRPLAFQRRFVSAALAPGVDTAVLSTPRGQGKSWLAGLLIASALTPRRRLFVRGASNILTAGSLDQARICFRFARQMLGEENYRYQDSAQRIGILHTASGTRLRVMSSDAKKAMGIVGARLVVADEPGAWDLLGGQNMYDAIQTSQGKNPMTVCYLGTIAPDPAGNWWTNLVTAGGDEGTHVTLLQGTQGAWDDWRTIAACNPLVRINPLLKRTLLRERDAARRDPRLKARFCSFRLNVPTADETTVLLTVDEWDAVIARPVPEAGEDRPYVGVDIGSERAWSSAVALYRTGLVVARAVAPGVPSLEAQEQRDLVPAGTYRALAATGSLDVDAGRQVVTVERLIETVLSWHPAMITCDRFKLGAVLDAVRGRCRVEPRVTRWSSASEDIRALRRAALDGPLAVEIKSQGLLTASLAVAVVKSDDQGSIRLVKGGTHNRARDDAAVALTLAAGLASRAPAPARPLRFVIAR